MLLAVFLAADSVYVKKPSKLPYYIMLTSSGLSAGMFVTGTVMLLSSSEGSPAYNLGGFLVLSGAFLLASSTTLSRIMYNDYKGGAISCCVKSASCALLLGASYFYEDGSEFDPLTAGAFSLSTVGCVSSSVYDAMDVYNVANMKVKTVEIIRKDTVYDTVKVVKRVVEKDTVYVSRVVKRIKVRKYKRKITPGDRKKALKEYNAGLEAFARDDLKKALLHFQKALEYDPTFEKAREAVRRVKTRLGK